MVVFIDDRPNVSSIRLDVKHALTPGSWLVQARCVNGVFTSVTVTRKRLKGADPVDQRPGLSAMLKQLSSNGVRTIIVETANRFARDLIVQETG
jgi:hypothetical protein